jgi:hypothetical protein
MDLVERYLQAVGFWLPRAHRQDIVAELSEDLRSQIEEQEGSLGRPLFDVEVGALLRQRGNPVVVANRFLPQEHLIGPALFPIYRFVLTIVAAVFLGPWALVWIGFLAFAPGFRTAHGGGSILATVGAFWGDFWPVLFIAAGLVTIVFAVLERTQARSALLEKWDPLKLPAVVDRNRIPRGNSVAELAGNLVFAVWLIAAMSSLVVLDRPGVRVTLAPVWSFVFWGYLLLSVANVWMAGANLVRPRWTRRRAALRLAANLIGSALFCLLCASNVVAEIAVAGVSPGRTREITNAINSWTSRGVPLVVVVGLVVLAVDVFRFLRAGTARSGTAANVAGGHAEASEDR